MTAVVTLGGTSAAAATCNASDEYTPCVSVQPTAAAPGQSVTVTGTGWITYGQLAYDVPIMFGFTSQGNFVADPVPSSNGIFTVAVTVPADARLGPTTVEGLNGNGVSPTTPFTVTPAANCPSVLFLGAHGVNEGSSTDWGNTVQAVWKAFHSQVSSAVPDAANYPYTALDWPVDLKTVPQASALQSKAQSAAQALETQMFNQFTSCGTRTRFVLAGFSLGAWAVDLTLRGLNSTVAGQAVLAQVAGAGVMGDPAFPVNTCEVIGVYQKCREGVATSFKHGYPNQSDYLANGLPNRFTSLCLSYSDMYLDPVCGGFGASSLFDAANVGLHEDGYPKSGSAAYLGGVLAGEAKP